VTAIHATAIVDPAAELDSSVSVGPYSIIGPHVKIAAGSTVGPHVVIEGHTTIGRDNRIFQFSSLGAIPQDKKYAGEPCELVIGDRNTIREFCTFNIGSPGDAGVTRVGDDNWLMAYVHLAHDCILGNNIVIANSVNLAGHVTIDDWAILEGNVAVQQFIHIGAHSFIAGASLVRKNVPPFVKAAREPLSYVGVNVVGLRRRGYDDAAVARIEDIYREIFVRNSNVDRAVQNVEQSLPRSPERGLILDFIRNSPRGIMRGLAE
jgi:UDP-N-acetylglucosamine acyltransferase